MSVAQRPDTPKITTPFFSTSLLTAVVAIADVAPAGDAAHGPVGSAGAGEGHGLHVLVNDSRLTQFHQHDVVVHGPGVVLGVPDGLGRHDVLLRALGFPDVVLAQADLGGGPAGVRCIMGTQSRVLLKQLR